MDELGRFADSSKGATRERRRVILPSFLVSANTHLVTEASMSWIVANIHRIMIVSGVLTMTMVYAAIAPDAALRSTFGEGLSGPVAGVVVRNWGALIALIGAMLIYAARKPAVRPLALTVAGASKAIFAALVLSHGGHFLGYQAGIAVIVDLVWVGVFVAYLLAMGRVPAVNPTVATIEKV
jgi:hypothetical protein